MSKKEILLVEKQFDDSIKQLKKLKKKTLEKMAEKQKEFKESDPTTDFKKEIKDRDKTIKKLIEAVSTLEESVEKLQKEIVAKVGEKNQLEKDYEELDGLYEECLKNYKSLEEQYFDAERKIESLGDEISARNGLIEDLNARPIPSDDEIELFKKFVAIIKYNFDKGLNPESVAQHLDYYEELSIVNKYYKSLHDHSIWMTNLSNFVYYHEMILDILCKALNINMEFYDKENLENISNDLISVVKSNEGGSRFPIFAMPKDQKDMLAEDVQDIVNRIESLHL